MKFVTLRPAGFMVWEPSCIRRPQATTPSGAVGTPDNMTRNKKSLSLHSEKETSSRPTESNTER